MKRNQKYMKTKNKPRQVPAWQVQTGSYSHEGYVFIFRDSIGSDGWPKVRLVSRLLPVDREEQERLAKIKPQWLIDIESSD